MDQAEDGTAIRPATQPPDARAARLPRAHVIAAFTKRLAVREASAARVLLSQGPTGLAKPDARAASAAVAVVNN